MVYIEEAHPADGWAFKDNIHIKSHRNAEERIAAARYLETKQSSAIKIVIDNMDDECSRAYGGLFERLYVLQNGVVAYQGGKGPAGFKVEEVENWLKIYQIMSSVDSVVPNDLMPGA